MTWYIVANSESAEQIEKSIKQVLQNHKFFKNLMISYKIPEIDIIHNLRIIVKDLKGKFAESNGHQIVLDTNLFANGLSEFMKTHFHFVAHEFFHWLKRRAEAMFYFNDFEEVKSFTLAIAWELISGSSSQDIRKKLYPVVSGHFIDSEKDNAEELFQKMEREAVKLVREMNG